MILYEGLLPGGRAVRFEKITTEVYLTAQATAAERVGVAPDPGGIKLKNAMACELIRASLRFVTHPLPWQTVDAMGPDGKPEVGPDGRPTGRTVVDVDAMLAAVGESAWQSVDQLALGMSDSPLSFGKLFAELSDFAAMTRLIAETLEPERRPELLAGKARRISV